MIRSFIDAISVQNVLRWVEHAAVVAGVAGVSDLMANSSGLTGDQTLVVIISAVGASIVRYLNKTMAV